MQTFPNLEDNPDAIQVEYVGVKTPIRHTVHSRVHRGVPYGRFVTGERFWCYRDDVELINQRQTILKVVEVEKPKTTRRKRKTTKAGSE